MNNLDDIQKDYKKLSNLPLDSDGPSKRRRGFAFERLLANLFAHDNLEPRTGYRPAGEQIDGSIYLDGRVYLIEAKWHADPLPASTLYQFKGKVDGKLAGTLGIFISMSGFAEDAVDALILGKGLNLILVDKRDMDAAISRGNGFKKVLKHKLRKAAEEGAIYFPSEGELVSAKETRAVEIEYLQFDNFNDQILTTQAAQHESPELLIICEGTSDRIAIATLAERILSGAGSGRSIKIMTAMGKLNIPRIANAMRSTFSSDSKILIVADGDNDPVGTTTMLARRLEFKDWVEAIPNPSIEAWLGLDVDTSRLGGARFRLERIRTSAQLVDIVALKAKDLAFARFHDFILKA